jgi:hypothetical protein
MGAECHRRISHGAGISLLEPNPGEAESGTDGYTCQLDAADVASFP